MRLRAVSCLVKVAEATGKDQFAALLTASSKVIVSLEMLQASIGAAEDVADGCVGCS